MKEFGFFYRPRHERNLDNLLFFDKVLIFGTDIACTRDILPSGISIFAFFGVALHTCFFLYRSISDLASKNLVFWNFLAPPHCTCTFSISLYKSSGLEKLLPMCLLSLKSSPFHSSHWVHIHVYRFMHARFMHKNAPSFMQTAYLA